MVDKMLTKILPKKFCSDVCAWKPLSGKDWAPDQIMTAAKWCNWLECQWYKYISCLVHDRNATTQISVGLAVSFKFRLAVAIEGQ